MTWPTGPKFSSTIGGYSRIITCLERLRPKGGEPEFPEWREDPKPAYQKLRAIYVQASARFAGKTATELCDVLYEPVLKELGFETNREPKASPLHIRLTDPAAPDQVLGLCLPWPWGRELDRKDEQRDSQTPESTPTFAVVELLAAEKAPWVILTNGKLWRLYSQRAHSRATNYYEIDLDEILGRQSFEQDIQDAFRFFWLLFRMRAFRPEERDWQGAKTSLSLLDRLLLGSEDYAKELGEKLKERVFEDVFPHLAEGFIAHIRRREPDVDFDNERLGAIYQATLTLLYRLLFLLYAEARDLLPVHRLRAYFQASLDRIKNDVAQAAGTIDDEADDEVRKQYADDSYELWKRLKILFRTIDQGSEELNVPRYNGGLFQAEREADDDSPEAQAARFLERKKIADRYLARAIDLLARGIDPKHHDLAFVDYKSLGVRQLGSIYEGLLEFHLRIAGEKLAITKEKGREVYSPFRKLGEKEKDRAERQGTVVRKGRAYLENDRRERKASGSYYTPDHIVDYIVEHAVGPVLDGKLEAMRPRLRDAQRERREFDKRQQEFLKRHMRPEPAEKADLIGRELVDELFNVKVLDPAMGSGHFLVEAVDFITDRILAFLTAFPWNPVQAHLRKMSETISKQMEEQNVEVDMKRLTDVNLLKRHVLKRCIYGVDLNPMAVELAKVSLWLDCFTLGAPLSFLDHHLRCGNSLIGAMVADVDKIRQEKGQLSLTATSDWTGLTQAVQLMVDVGGMPDITAQQVSESRHEYKQALTKLESFKRVLDLHTARWFVEIEKVGKGKKGETNLFDDMLRSGDLFEWAHGRIPTPLAGARDAAKVKPLVEQVLSTAREKRFFHWELEFPEVFYGRRPGTRNAVALLDNPGFDAVIGNPPFIDKKHIVRQLPECDSFWKQSGTFETARGIYDAYMLFVERGKSVCAERGVVSLLTPIPWLTQSEGGTLRRYVQRSGRVSIMDFSEDQHFDDALVKVVALMVTRGSPSDQVVVQKGEAQRALKTAELDEVFSGQFRIDVPTDYLAILRKIKRSSVSLGSVYTPTFGLRACSRELGRFDKGHFVRVRNECRTPVKYIESKNLRNGNVEWDGRWLDYRADEIYSPRTPELFEQPKILVPSLLSRRFLKAVLDREGYYADQSLVCISENYELPRLAHGAHRPSLGSVVAQINSRVLNFFFAHAVVGEALGGGAIHATPGLLARLPVSVSYDPSIGTDVDRALAEAYGLDEGEWRIILNWAKAELRR